MSYFDEDALINLENTIFDYKSKLSCVKCLKNFTKTDDIKICSNCFKSFHFSCAANCKSKTSLWQCCT